MIELFENSKTLKLPPFPFSSFVEEVNHLYLSPKEISKLIASEWPEWKDEKILDLVLTTRNQQSKFLYPLTDLQGQAFHYWITPHLEKQLQELEEKTKNEVGNGPFFEELHLQALIDEAYYSSKLEGITLEHERAVKIIRKRSRVANAQEQAFLNHFLCLEFVLKKNSRLMNDSFLCEAYQVLTHKIANSKVEISLYKNASLAKEQMKKIYALINQDDSPSFQDSVFVKAFILHFYILFVRPFGQKSEALARAFSYAYLLKKKYNLIKYFSPAKQIFEEKKTYYKAILNVVGFDADLSYFIFHCTNLFSKAVNNLNSEKDNPLLLLFLRLQNSHLSLNDRQQKLFQAHWTKKIFPLSIEKYASFSRVAPKTARVDLIDLCEKDLLKLTKTGRVSVFDLK